MQKHKRSLLSYFFLLCLSALLFLTACHTPSLSLPSWLADIMEVEQRNSTDTNAASKPNSDTNSDISPDASSKPDSDTSSNSTSKPSTDTSPDASSKPNSNTTPNTSTSTDITTKPGTTKPGAATLPTPTPAFGQFAMDIFRNEVCADTISLHYTVSRPADYGITDVPVTLGSLYDETVENPTGIDALLADRAIADEQLADWYEQLVSYPYNELDIEEKRTYDCLKRILELSMDDNYSPYLEELLGPTTGLQAQLPILLAEYRFDTKDDIQTYLDLLPCVYDYFKQIAEWERAKSRAGFFMNDTTAQDIIDQCLDFVKNPDENFLIATFEEKLNEFSELSVPEHTRYIMQNRSALYTYVIPAYELLADALTECLGTGVNQYGLFYYEHGTDYYQNQVYKKTGSDRTIKELKELLLTTIEKAYQDIADAMLADPTLYSQYQNLAFPETEPRKIMDYLMEATSKDFPVLDCKDYSIKYIPKSLQEHVSPAMYLIPPIDSYERNVIYINPNPAYDMDAIFPTVAHEGYPGHLYQNVTALQNGIHPLRYLLSPTGYNEGWATYVESCSYNYIGCSKKLASFFQADLIATLCLYSISDIYIHNDGYKPEQLARFLKNYGFSNTTSNLIYETLLAEPVVYLPYAVGCLEFEALKTQAKKLWKDSYSDYRFHEFLMDAGPLPFSVLGTLLEETK